MHILLEHRSGIPIYKQVFDQIKFMILSERLKEGEQLMSVRDLALALQINPMTISKSYSLLEREGFVTRKRGIGLFVSKPISNDQAKTDAASQVLKPVAQKLVEIGITFEGAGPILRQLMTEVTKKG